MSAAERKPAQSEVGDKPEWSGTGVPAWMEPYGVKKGEWMSLLKKQLQTQMRPGNLLKEQVYACGLLHTAGYRGELAKHQIPFGKLTKTINLTPAIIIREIQQEALRHFQGAGIEVSAEQAKQLKVSKEELRRAIETLEREGRADRKAGGVSLREQSKEARQRLSAGRIDYYFYLRPKPAAVESVQADWARITRPSISDRVKEVGVGGLPVSDIPKILKLFDIAVPGKEILADPAYQDRISQAWQTAKKLFAEVAAPELPLVATPEIPMVAAAGGAFESIEERVGEKTTTTAEGETTAPSEALVVVAKMGIPIKRARTFLGECRTAYPGCTLEDILAVIDHKARGFGRNITNPTGLLLISVPERLLALWQEQQHEAAKGAGG